MVVSIANKADACIYPIEIGTGKENPQDRSPFIDW